MYLFVEEASLGLSALLTQDHFEWSSAFLHSSRFLSQVEEWSRWRLLD